MANSGERLAKMEGGMFSPEAVMVLVASTLALYNSIELLILIFIRFKVRSGLYFWSILLASFSIIPYCTGWILEGFYLAPEWLGMAICSTAWMFLITGHSMVLFSRLHLVLQSPRILHVILMMIIINSLIWYPITWTVYFGSRFAPGITGSHFTSAFNVVEIMQMTFFCIQEFIISGIYIWKILDILDTSLGSKRAFIWQLCAINVFIIIIDIGLLAIEYSGLYIWEVGIKAVTYSIKLKLEFAVLGQLVDFVRHDPLNPRSSHFVEIPDGQIMKDNKRRSMLRKETSRMNDITLTGIGYPSTTATGASPALLHPREGEHRKFRARSEAGGSSADRGYESSSSHLYEVALQEILKPAAISHRRSC